jgi:hypothetical protein
MTVTGQGRARPWLAALAAAFALTLSFAAGLSPGAGARADEPASQQPAPADARQPDAGAPPARARIAFWGPELFKLDWGAPVLAVGDVNGDGLLDLVSFNPAQACIECFLQKRPGAPSARTTDQAEGSQQDVNTLPDDARFERAPLAVEQQVFSLACADFTGDGRDDLCYYGEPNKLIIREQGAEGTWVPAGGGRTSFDLPEGSRNPGALVAGDFDGDGRTDVAAVGRNVLYLITHEKDGSWAAVKKLPASAEGSSFILAGDFDGDGRLDLAYSTTQADAPLCFRLQVEGGGLGPEQFAEVPRFRAAAPVGRKEDRRAALAFILATSGRLELRGLTSQAEAQVSLERVGPLSYPLEEDKAERRFAVCDLDGDGRLEVVATYPSTAQVGVMFQAARGIGFRDPLLSPSFTGVSDLAAGDLDGDGRAEVVVLSKGEDSLGYSRWLSEEAGPGRLDFPRPISVTGHPLAVALADLNGDGRQEVLYARKEEKTYSVSWRGLGEAGDFSEERSVELAGLDTDVSGLVASDLNGDGHLDVLALVGFGPARLLLGDGEGQFRDTSIDPALVRTLLRGLAPGGVTLGDANGDGREELIVANKNFARVLTVGPDGTPSVLEQASGKSARSVVVSAAVGSLSGVSGDGRPEVVLLDSWAKEVTVLRRLADGTLGDPHSIALRGLPLQNARVTVNDFTGDGKLDILILTQGGLALIPLGRAKPEFELLAGYESDAEHAGMGDVVAGDLFGDGEDQLLVLDVTNHSLELLRWEEANLRRLYRFTVFEKKVFRGREQGDAEPRQALIADLTGDGLADIALLVHDRIALYPQVAPEASEQQPPPPPEAETEPAGPAEKEGAAQ